MGTHMEGHLRDFDLGGGRVQAFLYRNDEALYMAVQDGLSKTARRAREIELQGYKVRPPRSQERFCLWPHSIEEIDEVSVKAQGRKVEEIEPDWVIHVKELWEFYRDFTSTVFWSELEPETVLAILRLLWFRGEISADGDWS